MLVCSGHISDFVGGKYNVLGSFRDWYRGYWTLVVIFGMLHRVVVSRVIYFLHCTLLVTLVFSLLFSVSCFRLWFLTVVSVSNTQGKTPPVPGSTIALVSNTGSTYNRVATKVRTYFEMRTDGQRFLCLKSRISILRRYL